MPFSIELIEPVPGETLKVKVTKHENGFIAHGGPAMDDHRVFLLFYRKDNGGRAGEEVVELPSIAHDNGPLHFITILAIVENEIVARDRREVRNGVR